MDNFSEQFVRLSETQRQWLTGWQCYDPLAQAFPHKRVVHAGMGAGARPAANPHTVFETALTTATDNVPEQTMAYVHIPFCHTHCTYCHFYLHPHKQSNEDAYIDLLVQEFQQVADKKQALWPKPLSAVYIGGGTPTDLSANNMSRLLDAIRTCLPLRNDAEITLEGRLHGYTDEKHHAALAGGVNRFSFGVQSFNTRVRKQLGRKLSGRDIAEHLCTLQKRNDAIIACDLMYGLPDQDAACWRDDLEQLVACNLDGVSIYQLNIFENGMLHKAVQAGKITAPVSTAEQSRYYQTADNLLIGLGYKRMQTSHYANTLLERSLYNAHSKAGAWVMPFGMGAGGFWNGHAFMQHRDMKKWRADVQATHKPVAFAIAQDHKQRPQQRITERFETTGSVPWLWLEQEIGCATQTIFAPLITAWAENGLVTTDKQALTLTSAGRFWIANITQAWCDALFMYTHNAVPQSLHHCDTLEIAAQG